MNQDHPIEALLRPPIEIWSAIVSGSACLICLIAPWSMMMPPSIGFAAALGFAVLAIWRARQAYAVMDYQRNLRRLRTYSLTADRIPVSRNKLFLGRGFRWGQKHTQRLRDTMRPQARPYVEPGPLYEWARRQEIRWEHSKIFSPLAKLLSKRSPWNPLAPLPPVGGNPALHGVEPDEQDVWMDLVERVGHALVLGTTRVGKTRLAEVLITQDIRRGDVVIVFDPKGDADLLKRVYAEAKRAGRQKQVYVFHLGYPRISARYNAVGSFSRITEVATRIANQLPNEGNSAAFREFAWRFTNIVARALVSTLR